MLLIDNNAILATFKFRIYFSAKKWRLRPKFWGTICLQTTTADYFAIQLYFSQRKLKSTAKTAISQTDICGHTYLIYSYVALARLQRYLYTSRTLYRLRPEIALLSAASRPALGPTQPPIQWVPWRQGREPDHLPPSSGEVKKGGAIPPFPHMSSWRAA
jgi:hypothetical protein